MPAHALTHSHTHSNIGTSISHRYALTSYITFSHLADALILYTKAKTRQNAETQIRVFEWKRLHYWHKGWKKNNHSLAKMSKRVLFQFCIPRVSWVMTFLENYFCCRLLHFLYTSQTLLGAFVMEIKWMRQTVLEILQRHFLCAWAQCVVYLDMPGRTIFLLYNYCVVVWLFFLHRSWKLCEGTWHCEFHETLRHFKSKYGCPLKENTKRDCHWPF